MYSRSSYTAEIHVCDISVFKLNSVGNLFFSSDFLVFLGQKIASLILILLPDPLTHLLENLLLDNVVSYSVSLF